MKKIFVLLFALFAAGQAFAATSGTACSNGTVTNIPAPGNNESVFVVRETPVRCSANVTVSWLQNSIAFAVGALSQKGKSYFQGTTGGGSISAVGCTGATCTVGQELTGLQAKLDAAT